MKQLSTRRGTYELPHFDLWDRRERTPTARGSLRPERGWW